MLVQKTYKTELDPTNKQLTLFRKACGIRRFVYNWGLFRSEESYRDIGKGLRSGQLLKDLNKIKDKEFPWMREVSTYVAQSAMRDLDSAYKHFFRRVKNGDNPGFPKFKNKKNGLGGFRLYKDIDVCNEKIRLPRIGWVKLKEKGYLPICGVKINSATIKEHAGRWFVAVQIEESIDTLGTQGRDAIALDLGLRKFVVDSDGLGFDAPKPLKKSLRKLQILQRKHSKKKKGSNNRKKHTRKLAKLHYKISCQRKDFLHKLSTKLTKTKSVIVVEDLNVEGMKKNHKLARSISDVSWAEFIGMLDYKSKYHGSQLFKVDRFFPSSKICSNCGSKKEKLELGERTYHCHGCGMVKDRDYNAAINLLKYYKEQIPIDHRNFKPVEKDSLESSMKQEPSGSKREHKSWRSDQWCKQHVNSSFNFVRVFET